jgi:DNA-binding CsgD family transcriptional regulator
MWRTILVFGAILAAIAAVLQALQYRVLAWTHPGEIYLFLFGAAFLGLGVWLGVALFRRPAPTPFAPNTAAQKTLGISEREKEVLELLAAGESNKGIAGRLNVSPNTVKTHVARLYEKLEASRRTEAIVRARELGIIK